MPVTRRLLERAISTLKRAKDFRFTQETLNTRYGDFDVFPAVDDEASFSPSEEGDAPQFLFWGAQSEGAFDSRGKLTKPFVAYWGGNRNDIQHAFALEGVSLRIEKDATPREGYYQSGRLLLSPQSKELSCDLLRLIEAFRALGARGVVALPKAGETQSAGWEDVNEKSRTKTAVFWHDQSHDRFDSLGQLSSPISLYWRGEKKKIGEVLTAHGFVVTLPKSEDTAIEVAPGKASKPPAIEALPEAPRASAPTQKTTPLKAEGPLPILASYRSLDKKPVVRLAFGPNNLLAVEQQGDMRGPPKNIIALVDATTGDLKKSFVSKSAHASCGGFAFLPDGRFLFSWYDLVFEEKTRNIVSFMLLKVWEPEKERELEIESSSFSHISDLSLSSMNQARSMVAMVTDKGVSIREIPPAGKAASAWRRIALLGGKPLAAYPVAAISPDGALILWSALRTQTLQCFQREKRDAPLWQIQLERGGNDINGLTFDPTSKNVIVMQPKMATRGGQKVYLRCLKSYSAKDGTACQKELEKKSVDVRCFAFHPKKDLLALAMKDGALQLLSYPEAKPLVKLQLPCKGEPKAMAFDADGARLIVGDEKGELVLFDSSGV